MFSLLVKRHQMIDPPPMSEIDTHCHILPGLDDGPSELDESLDIAESLIQMGVRTVVATPHVMSDTYPLSSEQIRQATAALQEELCSRGLALEVLPGAEYYVESQFLQRIDQGDILAWGEERCVLFETAVAQASMLFKEAIFQLSSAGYTPVLAHVERYHFLQNNPEAMASLKKMGTRFQVNYRSFGLPRVSQRGETARQLYIKGMIDYLGTDSHCADAFGLSLAARSSALSISDKIGR